MFKLYIITIIVYADDDEDNFIFFRSYVLNLQARPSRRVPDAEMNRISRSTREAPKSFYGTVAKCLRNGIRKRTACGEAFWVYCMLSMLWDAVFLYIPVINDERKCFQFDIWAMSLIIAERSVFDILYLINRTLEVRENIHRNYTKSLLPVFVFDLPISLPLPQVLVILAHSQVMSGQAFFFFMIMFLVQHGLKVVRLYALITKRMTSDNLTKWAKRTFYLFYLHAANVIGSLWYFFAVQRKTACWRKACTDSTRCDHLTLHCDDSLTNYTFSNDFCSAKTQNATIYDFGIFHDAIQSGVVEQNNFFRRFLPGIQWSLQNLSSFGQGLPLSTNVLENIFVISITITGALVFSLLVDRALSKLSKEDERRQKVRELNKWQPFRKLPRKLQREIEDCLSSKLEETTDVDVEYVMHNLPEDIGNNLKQKLCLDLLEKVKEFREKGDPLLKELCDVVTPIVFPEGSYILEERESIDQMLFVLQGKLRTYTSGSNHQEEGDFSGEQLIDFSGEKLIEWAKANGDLPKSTKTIKALTNVEAFVLRAYDLKRLL